MGDDILAVARRDGETKFRVLAVKFVRRAGHEAECRGLARANGYRARKLIGISGFDLRLDALGKVNKIVRALPEGDALLGQRNSTRVALKELVPELVLQCGELRGERGLRDMKPLGGAGDVPLLRHSEKAPEYP